MLIKTVIVNQGQNLIDVSIQHCGSIDYVFEIAKLNNISITDDILPGFKLKVPIVNNDTAKEFSKKGTVIATY